jgi:hypothetical protein
MHQLTIGGFPDGDAAVHGSAFYGPLYHPIPAECLTRQGRVTIQSGRKLAVTKRKPRQWSAH